MKWLFSHLAGRPSRPRAQSSPSATRLRLEIEPLDDRLLPSVATFGTYAGSDFPGTWAYKHDTGQWRLLTPEKASVIDGDGRNLFGSFSTGTYRYDYLLESWTQLTPWRAKALSTGGDGSLFASFGGKGTYEFDHGNWHRLSTTVAKNLAAVSEAQCYASFSDRGTYEWNDGAGWTRISTRVPYAMDAQARGNLGSPGALIASYSSGTYRYNPGATSQRWTKLYDGIASNISVAPAETSSTFVTFAATFYGVEGTYKYRDIVQYSNGAYGGGFTPLNSVTASHLHAAGSNSFVLSFGSSTSGGTYLIDGNGYGTQISWYGASDLA